jgi:hypothetical protein
VKRRQQAPPKHNYQCTWYYIPKDRNLHLYHSKPLTLWVEHYFSYHHCSAVQQELLLHSDITKCICPLNCWIKCPNLGSELLSFCGSINFQHNLHNKCEQFFFNKFENLFNIQQSVGDETQTVQLVLKNAVSAQKDFLEICINPLSLTFWFPSSTLCTQVACDEVVQLCLCVIIHKAHLIIIVLRM